MRKILVCLVLLSLFALLSSSNQGQTRPRRANDAPATKSEPPAPADQSPTSPPVLRGANNPPNREPAPVVNVPSGPEEVDPGDVIRVNTLLVTLPVSVMDRDGRYVPNLRKEDFRIMEDGIEHDVAFFSSVDKPFSVVLMLDTSRSTRFRLEEIHEAAITFIIQLRPNDRVMVVSFDNDIKVLADFTTDRHKLTRAIRDAHTGDGTRLYDAVDLVINQRLPQVSGRKAVVLFTDGVDTTSKRATYQSNVLDSEELDALIYPVQYDTFFDVGGNVPTWPRYPTDDILGQILGGILGGGRVGRGGRGGPAGTSRRDYDIANRYLEELSARTGARKYLADSTQNLDSAFSNIAEELRRQYSIGYYPKRAPYAGERRQIRVRVNQPNLAVRARSSYVFNPEESAAAKEAQKPPVLKKLPGERQDER